MRIPRIVLIVLLVFSACKKEQAYKINASAITEVDENGDRTGSVDPTDWRFDDQWNDKELSLFNFGDSITTWGMQKATNFSAGAAPNPASAVMMLSFSSNQPTLLKWVITDEYLNVLFTKAVRLERYSNVDPNMGFGIDVRNSKFKEPGYYRVYYALYSQGGELYKKGHGDFKKL
jgi:hypothetical protein